VSEDGDGLTGDEQAEVMLLTLDEAVCTLIALRNTLTQNDLKMWSRMVHKARLSGRGELLVVVKKV
jgi:hypothetical protein